MPPEATAGDEGFPRLEILILPIGDLRPDPRNSRQHSEEQVREIVASMHEFGWTNPILADLDDGGLIAAGHGRLMAAQQIYAGDKLIARIDGETLPAGFVPVIDCSGWSPEQRRKYVIADNRLAEKATWDLTMLRIELEELDLIDAGDADLQALGFTADELNDLLPDLDAGNAAEAGRSDEGSLYDRFLIPPFSVLDSRLEWWTKRKRAWIGLGIRSEIGRGTHPSGSSHRPSGSPRRPGSYARDPGRAFKQDIMRGESRLKKTGGVLYDAPSAADTGFYRKKRALEARLGREVSTAEFVENFYTPPPGNSTVSASGTSIFDPVLTELLLRWFSPPGGQILDPFAGGSVRGVIAGRLGRAYTGIDLRADQIAVNEGQADALIDEDAGHLVPEWIVGDAQSEVPGLSDDFAADFVFSCPPYADLEVYSDDPRDLSTMDYASFIDAYRAIIAAACERLAENRFAAFVVSEVRDKSGNYRGFVRDTIDAFRDAGLALYNEAVLFNHYGSVAMRVGRQFDRSRKLGRTHQNVLVFVKGDARMATEAIGPVEHGPVAGGDIDFELPDPEDFTPDVTPIERHGDVYLKRDDLWCIAGVPGGKVRTCWALAQGAGGLVTAGSRASPQVNIVAHVAQRLGIPCRAHTPSGDLSAEVQAAELAGAEIVQHDAGRNTVIVARAREDAEERGWTEIPFGMECEEAINQTRRQVQELPADVGRIVVPVGSGMSLAGVLWGMVDQEIDRPVIGVVVGADPVKRLDKYGPPDWRDRVELVPAGADYHDDVDATIGGVRLDPHYEAKCAEFLEPGDLLWIVGVRQTELKRAGP